MSIMSLGAVLLTALISLITVVVVVFLACTNKMRLAAGLALSGSALSNVACAVCSGLTAVLLGGLFSLLDFIAAVFCFAHGFCVLLIAVGVLCKKPLAGRIGSVFLALGVLATSALLMFIANGYYVAEDFATPALSILSFVALTVLFVDKERALLWGVVAAGLNVGSLLMLPAFWEMLFAPPMFFSLSNVLFYCNFFLMAAAIFLVGLAMHQERKSA